MGGTVFTPDVGAMVNQDDAGDPLLSWMAYDGREDGALVDVSTFTSAVNTFVDVCILSSTRAVLAVKNSFDSSHPYVALIDISGTTPVVLDTLKVKAATTDGSIRIATIDSRYCAVVFYSTNEKGRIIDTDSDTLVLVGSEQDLDTNLTFGTGGEFDIDALSATALICAFRDENAANIGAGSVIGINTTTGAMTDNTVGAFAGIRQAATPVRVVGVDSAEFLFTSQLSSFLMEIASGTVSGTTVTKMDSITGFDINSQGVTGYPLITDDATLIGSIALENGDSQPVGITVLSYDGTAGSSAMTAVKSSGFQESHYSLIYIETIGNVDYFMGMGTSISGSDLILSGYSRDRTTERFVRSVNEKDTLGTSGNNIIEDVALEKISSSKVFVVIRDDADAKVKCYIANL